MDKVGDEIAHLAEGGEGAWQWGIGGCGNKYDILKDGDGHKNRKEVINNYHDDDGVQAGERRHET